MMKIAKKTAESDVLFLFQFFSSIKSDMSVDCLETVVTIVEAIDNHQSIIRKLLKSLRECCARGTGSSSSTSDDEGKAILIEEVMNEMNELCEGRGIWSPKDRRKWKVLAKKLVKLGEWIPEAVKDTPWQMISVSKEK
jgi:hypothetical protein